MLARARADLRHSGFMRLAARVLWLAPCLCAAAAIDARALGQQPESAATAPAAPTLRQADASIAAFALPAREELTYRAEWRLTHAGNVRLIWESGAENGGWRTTLKLQSAGLVSRLYRVNNEYTSALDDSLCASHSMLKAHEGRKRRETLVTFDAQRKKASYLERDLVKNAVVAEQEIDIPGCVHDVIGGLYKLRTMHLEPGQSVQLPISDGKKSVLARVEAQERQRITVRGVSYDTIRYEAFLFNNVLYRRRGRLFLWLTDDARRLPVQIRLRFPFYIGTVTLELQPEKKAGANRTTEGGI